MEGYGQETYGAIWAPDYDRIFGSVAPGMIDRLSEYAEDGAALEFAIGTGRVALPLAERGVPVSGIDISPEMVARLRAKPGGADIPVVMGDFARARLEGEFRLVYLIFNTLFALPDQESQILCFENAAAHLEVGGRFVTETFYPDLTRFDRGQRFGVLAIELDQIQVEASKHDPINQQIDTQRVHLGAGASMLYPVQVRYAWPSEMDLMARLAGLRLEDRFGGWNREPFASRSLSHVSVYRKL